MSTSSPSAQLSPQLDGVVHELDEVSAGFKALAGEIGQAKLWQRPAKGGWSVAECLDHLTTTTNQMVPRLESLLATAPTGSEPYSMDLKGRLLVWFMEPPYRMKFKAVLTFQPHAENKDVLAEFLASQEAAINAVRRCNGVALNKTKFISPVDARMSYNGFAALKLLPAHQRRHLWQARQIVKHL
jgi:hypothetical protein